MQAATRRSVLSIALVVALLAVAAIVVLPALADPPPPDGDLNLHTDANGVTTFSLGSSTQLVENGKGCLIKDLGGSGSLITLGSTGKAKPGYVRGIGLKTGGSNGTPCSQVDEDDAGSLVLTSNAGPWESMELDLELKQNAKIFITVSNPGVSDSESFVLLTGSSFDPDLPDPDAGFPYGATVTPASSSTKIDGVWYPAVNCANPSDSGPDSGPNDNCRLTVIPDMTFNTVTITALIGAVSLEGGADFVALDPAKQDAGDYDSIFVYAKEICEGDTVSARSGAVSGTFTLLDADACKRYQLSVSDEGKESVTFTPKGTATATFRGVLTFSAQDVSGSNSLALLEYDPDGVFPFLGVTMPVCQDPTFVDGNVTSATIPGTDTWCLVSVTAVADEFGNLAPEYVIYGEGDPIFRIK